jgi:hypothetical protein
VKAEVLDAEECSGVLSGEAYPRFVGKLYEGVRGEISREYYCSAYCMVKWASEFFTDGGLLAVDLFRGLVTNQIAASVFGEAPWHDLGDGDGEDGPDSPSTGTPRICRCYLVSKKRRKRSNPARQRRCQPPDTLTDTAKPMLARLEATAEKGVKLLEKLRRVFEEAAVWTADKDWVTGIKKTIKHSGPTRFVIGVVGSTGAGKSSVINAIADEENVPATNCMRASTAVATEASYNHGDSKYRAEIEFIKPKHWRKELEILFREIEDNSDGAGLGAAQKDSEAAVALAKIKAVYPSLEQKDILNSSVEQLMGFKNVTGAHPRRGKDRMMTRHQGTMRTLLPVWSGPIKRSLHITRARDETCKHIVARSNVPDRQVSDLPSVPLTTDR